MITKGTNQINKIALGANEIGRIYLGNGVVYGEEVIPYDAELEYLQSAGTAYIDSGIECTADLSVECKIMLLSNVNAAAAGAIAQTSNGYFRHHLTMSGVARYYLQNNSSGDAAFYGGTSPSLNTWYEIAIYCDANHFNGISDGTVLAVRSSYRPLPTTLSAGCNYGIFARLSPTMAVQGRPCRFAYFKLSRNGSTLRDFIPVRVGTVGYMYDKVTKQLFGNEGTDSFILGPDK